MKNPKGLLRSIVCLLSGSLLLAGPLATSALAQSSTKSAATAVAVPASPVDVNSADLKTLETLPGVGPAVAKRIVEGRPYKTLQDLEKVKGLGKTKADALKDQVRFGPSSSAVAIQPATAPKHSSATAEEPVKKTSASATSATSTTHSSPPASQPEAGSHPKMAPGEHVNINTATAEQLDRIPGIGPAKAKAIVEYREQNGRFSSIEDIEKVRGIKGGVFAKIKDYIKVSD